MKISRHAAGAVLPLILTRQARGAASSPAEGGVPHVPFGVKAPDFARLAAGRLAQASRKRPWSPETLRKDGAFEAALSTIHSQRKRGNGPI